MSTASAQLAPPVHSKDMAVLMFTDIVDSLGLKERLGNAEAAQIIDAHDRLFRRSIEPIEQAIVLKDTGDGFLTRFAAASDAVRVALVFQHEIQNHPWPHGPLRVRIGVHIGEVEELESDIAGRPKLVGLAADMAARVMSIALGGQILMTRTVFDAARLYIREYPIPAVNGASPCLEWVAHGPFRFAGVEETIGIFEVGAAGIAPLTRPANTEKVRYSGGAHDETLGAWRPSAGVEIPGRKGWKLDRKLGEGSCGEAWLARHIHSGSHRAFKFAFDPHLLRSLKREITLIRLLNDSLGKRDDIVRIYDVRLDEAPYYIEMDFAPDGDLRDWAERRGGVGSLALNVRVELIAAVATAVAAAHSVGVLHKDIKPSNILIEEAADGTPCVRLSDFGIGQLTTREALSKAGLPRGAHETRSFPLYAVPGKQAGTHLYMAPELFAGMKPTVQSDVYSLGVMLYQLLVGDLNRPFGQGWERDISDPLLREDIAACVEANPSRRLAGAEELARRLRGLDARRHVVPKATPAPDDETQTSAPGFPAVHTARKTRRDIECDLVVGIDLGTTNSAIARVDADGSPRIVTNLDGERITPSAVHLSGGRALVGRMARDVARSAPNDTIVAIKRDIGRRNRMFKVGSESWTPEELSSFILRKVVHDANAVLDLERPIRHAVITVPAYFNERQRKATADAGKMAGLEVLGIINEPTAAALSYGFNLVGDPKTILVYDLGGGTFDVTIMRIENGLIRMLATDGDARLGGRDWDRRVADYAAEVFTNSHGFDPRESTAIDLDLLENAEQAKIRLSRLRESKIAVNADGRREIVTLTRDAFEGLTHDLISQTEMTLRLTLEAAGLKISDIDEVMLVGGATRMKAVHSLFNRLFGFQPSRLVNPDEAVALGAAIYGTMRQIQQIDAGESIAPPPVRPELLDRFRQLRVHMINTHTLGIQALLPSGKTEVVPLIARHSEIPLRRERKFETNRPGQRVVRISIMEGESPFPEACMELGTCFIENLPDNLPEGTEIEVQFEYDEDSRLRVWASLPEAGHHIAAVIERSSGFSAEQLETACRRVKAIVVE